MNLSPPSTGNPDLDVFLYQVAEALGGVSQSSSTPAPGGYSPSGNLVQYPLRYIHVKFADDNIGTGITDLPAGKLYFGLYNSSSSTESVNPADYTWLLVSGGGMGTTKNFWYRTIGGSYLDYAIASASPGNLFTIDTGGAIDLNINVTAEDTIGRVAFAKAATQQLTSAPYNVATLGSSSFPAAGTWGFAEIWQGTAPVVTGNEILFQLDGVYNASTNTTVWGAPYLAAFKVGQLSAIQANLGSITAGAAAIGSSPAISGTTMTGSGVFIGATGQAAIGNAANNFVFDGAIAYINGFAQQIPGSLTGSSVYAGVPISGLTGPTFATILDFVATTKKILVAYQRAQIAFDINTGGGEFTIEALDTSLELFNVTAGATVATLDFVRRGPRAVLSDAASQLLVSVSGAWLTTSDLTVGSTYRLRMRFGQFQFAAHPSLASYTQVTGVQLSAQVQVQQLRI
jgi:hypothetical protein